MIYTFPEYGKLLYNIKLVRKYILRDKEKHFQYITKNQFINKKTMRTNFKNKTCLGTSWIICHRADINMDLSNSQQKMNHNSHMQKTHLSEWLFLIRQGVYEKVFFIKYSIFIQFNLHGSLPQLLPDLPNGHTKFRMLRKRSRRITQENNYTFTTDYHRSPWKESFNSAMRKWYFFRNSIVHVEKFSVSIQLLLS